MTIPTKPKLNIENSALVRIDDLVGASLPSSSDFVGLMLGIMLGFGFSILDSAVGWLVGLSSIIGSGDTNLDIGNKDGQEEGLTESEKLIFVSEQLSMD